MLVDCYVFVGISIPNNRREFGVVLVVLTHTAVHMTLDIRDAELIDGSELVEQPSLTVFEINLLDLPVGGADVAQLVGDDERTAVEFEIEIHDGVV